MNRVCSTAIFIPATAWCAMTAASSSSISATRDRSIPPGPSIRCVPASRSSTIHRWPGALLAGDVPPAVTTASEQYAIAVLAYLLLTGLHPIDAPAVHDELLQRIVERSPLPFVARGVPGWPEVEAVVGRGLAKQPADRFPDVLSLARAFSTAGPTANSGSRWPDAAQRAFDDAVEAVRCLAPPRSSDHVWFAMRAALALEDAELLAAADLLVARAGPSWTVQSVAALVARARSDIRNESKAIARFLSSAERLHDRRKVAGAATSGSEHSRRGDVWFAGSRTSCRLGCATTRPPHAASHVERGIYIRAAVGLSRVAARQDRRCGNSRRSLDASRGTQTDRWWRRLDLGVGA